MSISPSDLKQSQISVTSQNDITNSILIDKDKLYETFVLFQSFLQNRSVNLSNNNQVTNNYDDIPIKINNTSFIELVEKSLANEPESMKSSVRKSVRPPLPKNKTLATQISKSERMLNNNSDIHNEYMRYKGKKKSRTINTSLFKGKTLTENNNNSYRESQRTNRTFDDRTKYSLEDIFIPNSSSKKLIEDTSAALKKENESLKKEVTDLKEKNDILLKENEALKAKIDNYEQQIKRMKVSENPTQTEIKASLMVQNEKKNSRSMKIFNRIKHKLFYDSFSDENNYDCLIPERDKEDLIEEKKEGERTIRTYKDGYILELFKNGDINQTFPNGKNIFYYKEAGVTQTTFSNGIKVYKFSNGQIEKHLPDGRRTALFPDGTFKYIDIDGSEELLLINNIPKPMKQTIQIKNTV